MDESLNPAARRERSRAATGRVTRIVRAVGWISLIAGVLVLGFVFQQLFVTSWLAERNQTALEEDARVYFEDVEVAEVPVSEVQGLSTDEGGEDAAVAPRGRVPAIGRTVTENLRSCPLKRIVLRDGFQTKLYLQTIHGCG